jgi:hypothetical protein
MAAFEAIAAEKVDFNKDVRPILSHTCFRCHGTDESSRKAKLRLDLREEALRQRKDIIPIVPGKPEKSEVWRRITTQDPNDQMPPPDSRIVLTRQEVETLGNWIRQGAAYSKHWAFELPKLPEVPSIARGAVAINPIDNFVVARLAEHGLRQNPEADRHTLIRRLSFDLIGLPPTREEVAAFVQDKSPGAYDRVVDRLLASPHYGEKWARLWLDLARYADSTGYGSDQLRLNMWPYRDWVIEAFNRNMPYDQFTIEQLAGDLLPNPTIRDRLATTLHRNTMRNTEGGTDQEEYRVAAVKDRVNTTMQVWMGLTAGCAQCHSHKFDPISQREYYQLFAIFNQTDDAERDDEAPLMTMPLEDQTRWEKIKAEIAGLRSQMKVNTPEFENELSEWSAKVTEPVTWQSLTFAEGSSKNGVLRLEPDGSLKTGTNVATSEKFTAQFKTSLKGITAFRLETLPEKDAKGEASLTGIEISAKAAGAQMTTGRFVRIEGLPGQLIHLAEVEVFSGGSNVARNGTASQSTTGYGGDASRAIDGNTNGKFAENSVSHTGDGDPNPFWEVDLGKEFPLEKIIVWNRTDGLEQRLAGAKLLVLDGTRKPAYSEKMAEAPQPSREFALSGWTRIDLNSASSDSITEGNGPENIVNGNKNSGWRIALDAPHAAVFEAAKPVGDDGETLLSITLNQAEKDRSLLTNFRFTATTKSGPVRELPPALRAILLVAPAQRSPEQSDTLADYFRPEAAAYSNLRNQIADAESNLARIKTVSVPVMQERTKDRRVSHILAKGNFLAPMDEVLPAVPVSFNPGPTNDADRLALAKWLMAPDNPMTARVAVNRFWAQLFGLGIVETEEDFGTQGSQPSNPELLDWLAVTFHKPQSQGGLGWDMKALLKLIVSSQTYRQSSIPRKAATKRDPRNQFVSHYSRRRLEAEAIRDQALAMAGLLSPRIGGPSVYPPQPDGLWEIAFRGKEDYPTSTGEDRWRRGLYTIWRRIAPNPTMAAFDAPNREVCTLRRFPTDTPLQSFVTLNDPVFFEAAQAFARRILREAKGGTRAKIKWALETALSRPATPTQIAAMTKLRKKIARELRANPDSAKRLAASPELPLPPHADAVELAEWTAIANVLLNLDAVLVKS